MHTSVPDFSDSIAAATRTINQARSLDETMQTIAEVAQNSIPGFDHVGISTLHAKGKVETRAFVGDLVLRLDEIQYGLEEGPCVDTLRGSDVVVAPTLDHDERWPRYVPRATELGVRSQLAVQLRTDAGGTLGGLNLYSTISDEVTQEAQALARLFATHSAIALGHAVEREQLHEGMRTRKVIGQAIGILMERYDMDEDRAFAYLVRASSYANIKLRAVAQELVDGKNAR